MTELGLLAAILLVAWHQFGDRLTATVTVWQEARSEKIAALPEGGPVAQGSYNPLLFIPYYWQNLRSDAPLLLPDLTPIIGADDDSIAQQYPNMERWLIDTVTQPGRTLLRINTTTANIGDGPLHVVGGAVVDADQQVVYQRIWRSDNTFTDRKAGHFVYHAGHDHIHFDEYAQYVLRLQEMNGTVIAEGGKVGFCLTDVLTVDNAKIEASSVHIPLPAMECGRREQGINAGYSDYYGAKLDEQWIDITDVPWGTYQLQVVVDPNNLIQETNEENNVLSMPLIYSEEAVASRAFVALDE